jgi:predicted dehydrogenase
MSLRTAVVGTSFGARIHVPAFRAAGFEVVALVGRDPARTVRRAERMGIDHPYTSLAEALDLGIDVVSIAGPPATHAPLALQAVEAGCHVLCEKPFTLDVGQAEQLVRAAAGAGVIGCLGHEFRWSPEQALIGWAIDSGLVGTPKLVLGASFISMLRSFSMPDWWFDPASGGGWLGASGSHRIDALRQWFGEVEAVSAGLPTVCDPPLTVDDSFDIRCVMRSGVDVSLIQSASAIGPAFSANRVVGTAGTLWSESGCVRIADADSPEGRRLDPPSFLALPDVEELAVGPLADMTRMELPPYIMLARAFRRAIEGELAPPGPRPASFGDGLACMQVVEAVRRSAADGGRWIAMEQEGQL